MYGDKIESEVKIHCLLLRIDYFIKVFHLAHLIKRGSVEDSKEVIEIDRDLIFMQAELVEIIDSFPDPSGDGIVAEPGSLRHIIQVHKMPGMLIISWCLFLLLCLVFATRQRVKVFLIRNEASINGGWFLLIGMSEIELEVLFDKSQALTLLLEDEVNVHVDALLNIQCWLGNLRNVLFDRSEGLKSPGKFQVLPPLRDTEGSAMLNHRFSKPALIGWVNDLHRTDLPLLHLPDLEGSEWLLNLHSCGYSIH